MDDDIPEEPLESFYGDEEPRLARPPAADDERPAASGAGAGRKRTVTGALMAGIAMGFRDVFQPEPHDRTAIEQPAPEQPLEPQKYEIHLDPVAPESSFAIYRPWVDEPGTDPDRPPAPTDLPERPRGGGAGALGG